MKKGEIWPHRIETSYPIAKKWQFITSRRQHLCQILCKSANRGLLRK